MTYRQFVVPSGQDIIEALGVEPTMVAGTETAQRFEVTIDGRSSASGPAAKPSSSKCSGRGLPTSPCTPQREKHT
jgi:hypothetical protein